MSPKFIRVIGLWNARGGIAIDVVVESGSLPPSCTPLPLGKTYYRGGRDGDGEMVFFRAPARSLAQTGRSVLTYMRGDLMTKRFSVIII